MYWKLFEISMISIFPYIKLYYKYFSINQKWQKLGVLEAPMLNGLAIIMQRKLFELSFGLS